MKARKFSVELTIREAFGPDPLGMEVVEIAPRFRFNSIATVVATDSDLDRTLGVETAKTVYAWSRILEATRPLW